MIQKFEKPSEIFLNGRLIVNAIEAIRLAVWYELVEPQAQEGRKNRQRTALDRAGNPKNDKRSTFVYHPSRLSQVSATDWVGFAYTIVRGAGCDTTFRFGVSTNELWQPWCALQTPIYSSVLNSWGCVARGNGGSSDGKTCTVQSSSGASVTYPEWKCDACGAFGFGGVCACDQNGCGADMTPTLTFDLTYSVSGTSEILSGPDPDTTCSNCTVRLERKN